jgi:hypothetical protein
MSVYVGYSKVSTGGNPFTTVDTRDTTKPNNNAQNMLGDLYFVPPNAALPPGNGGGAGLVLKYVRYQSTTNAAVVAGPAPVYFTDQTFQTVSGTSTEGFAGLNSVAGLLLPNSTSISGLTAALLNGNFVWIAVAGWVAGCIAPGSTVAGDAIIAAAGNFTPARVAANTAPTNKLLGWATSAVSSGLCNILLDGVVF